MTELSVDQLSYLATIKAQSLEKLVLNAGRETVERFLDVWKRGRPAHAVNPKITEQVNELIGHIPLVKEADTW